MTDDRPIVILTRPERAARRFANSLEAVLFGRATILIAPVIEIVPEPVDGNFSLYKTLIFTSENAILSLGDIKNATGHTAYCVGDRTAETARHAGFAAVSAAGDAEALEARLLADAPPDPWLHLSGAHRSSDLAERLTTAGHRTDRVVTYRQEARPLSANAVAALRERMTILPVFSPRSAALLSEAIPADASPPIVVAISPAAARSWAAPARAVRIAPNPDAGSVAATICAALDLDAAC
jgi:uroporphyrinogen-III synthase